MKRQIYFVSDRTGITAETLGQGLLTQFPSVEFERHTLRYVDTVEKARKMLNSILESTGSGQRPIVMSTLIEDEIREVFERSDLLVIDLFGTFIGPLEDELRIASSHKVGHTHGRVDDLDYTHRIEAVNYTISTDDGLNTRHYDVADVILVGVSRCGKTPTSLYMAMQFGIKVANYPLTEDDLMNGELPKPLQPYRRKLFGLTIEPQRLSQIRSERLNDSHYASLRQCREELENAEAIFRKYAMKHIDVTQMSVEEIATTLIDRLGL
ncbi:MAG: kinase/pyrophosphorylase [Gammaproteobacteria bacterium]|nr:kinase/pyrophosphorylase [Gammaproteobacteria bacterium]